MSIWHEYVQRSGAIPEWPYRVDYDKVNYIRCDVLVIGGGVAGVRAAISAAQSGVTVALVDAGHAKRSGAGGAGVDHWHGACTNPCSRVTPEEYTQACYESMQGYLGAHVRYIIARESWDTLLECEKWGMQIRDVRDEFKGADFRDEETKLLFAYDYDTRHVIRVWGWNVKPVIYQEAVRQGVNIFNHVCATSLLTEGGRQGARVVGATAVSSRTGEFYVFKAKATIIATSGAGRLYFFAPELTAPGAMADMTAAGVGHSLGWKAGAELLLMEKTGPAILAGLNYAPYSTGNAHNTYHGASIVDANGKEVPWEDPFGRLIPNVAGRFRCAPGQEFQLGAGIGISAYLPQYDENRLVRDLPERIRKGEFTLPLYMDLTLLPEPERRVIWGMMVGNEGKTRVPIYEMFSRAGFDPEQDLLQAPVLPLEAYDHPCFWGANKKTPRWIRAGSGKFWVDWDLRTSLEGLYAASSATAYGGGCHGESHTTGRYAGRKAAQYAKSASLGEIASDQVEGERARVYAAVKRGSKGLGWKEVNAAIARVMQDYCGEYKNEQTLREGLWLLNELRNTELAEAGASNPHELVRLLECSSLIDFGEAMMQASLARKASSRILDFHRLDYPELDPPEWKKLLTVRQEEGEVVVREVPQDYFLREPYADSLQENYNLHK
ncbi:MAG: FAD-binding protein [Thermoleophilia bacterium]|nr:FAD-binding protein [Thermoleophilia bacterium]